MSKQTVVIMEGPDRCGKTNIGKDLSREIKIPYFKATYEKELWGREDGFLNALHYDQRYLAQFLSQTKHSCIIDRAYPSEIVYSKVFNRKTDSATAWYIDSIFGAMNATIILLTRRNLDGVDWDDELVPVQKFRELHNEYMEFIKKTKCNVITMHIDDYAPANTLSQLEQQVKELNDALLYITKKQSGKRIHLEL